VPSKLRDTEGERREEKVREQKAREKKVRRRTLMIELRDA